MFFLAYCFSQLPFKLYLASRLKLLLSLVVFVTCFTIAAQQSYGAISLQSAIEVPTAGNGGSITAADFNSDGFTDVANARFATSTAGIVYGSDTDAKLLETNAGGTQASEMDASDTVAADFNTDGHPDLAVLFPAKAMVAVIDGSPGGLLATEKTFSLPASDGINDITTADLDNDGHQDLVLACKDADGVRILFGDGRGNFPDRVFVSTGERALHVAAGDVNYDGYADLVTTDWFFNTTTMTLGKADRTFAKTTVMKEAQAPRTSLDSVLADLNQDGKLDLVSISWTREQLEVLLGQGDGAFANQQVFPLNGEPAKLSVADIDSDGVLDAAVTLPASDELKIFSGTTQTNLLPTVDAVKLKAGTDPKNLVAADINGDGYGDIAVTSSSTKTLSLLQNSEKKTAEAFASVKALNFSDSTTPTTASRTVYLSNGGDAFLHVKALDIQGVNGKDFVIKNETCTKQPIAVGKQCSIEVSFNANVAGARTAALHIVSKQPVKNRVIDIPLSAVGFAKSEPERSQEPLTEVPASASVASQSSFSFKFTRGNYQGRVNAPIQIGFLVGGNAELSLTVTRKKKGKTVKVKKIRRSLAYYEHSLVVNLSQAGTYQLTAEVYPVGDPKQSVRVSSKLVVKKKAKRQKDR